MANRISENRTTMRIACRQEHIRKALVDNPRLNNSTPRHPCTNENEMSPHVVVSRKRIPTAGKKNAEAKAANRTITVRWRF